MQSQDEINVLKDGSSYDSITYKSKRHISLVILNIALSTFYFGYTSLYLAQLHIDMVLQLLNFQMDPNLAKGLLNGAMSLGALFGSALSFIMVRRLSRRQCHLAVNLLAITAGALLYIPNFYCFLLFRMCQGFAVGTYTVIVPLIIKELAPTQISGTLGSYTQLSICSGGTFGCLLSYVLKKMTGDDSGQDFWFIVYGFNTIVVLFQTIILLFVFPYQTPKYWLSVGKEQEARKLIQCFYKEQFVDKVLAQKKEDLQATSNKKNIHEESLLSDSDRPQKVSVLFQLMVAFHLSALQQFSGVNAIAVFGGDIAAKSASKELSLLIPSLINFQQIIGGLATGFLIIKFGRKTLLQFGTMVATVGHLLVAFGFYLKYSTDGGLMFVIIGLVLFMAAYSISLGPIIWLYIPEIIDAKSIPLALFVHWITYFIVIFLFPILTDNILHQNPTAIFIFFAIYLLVSVIINDKVMVETKDKSDRQIKQEYLRLKLC